MMRLPAAQPKRVWAEINISGLLHNRQQLRQLLGPETQLMAVVKADSYGHGADEIARPLAKAGVDAFAVATLDEGLQLRRSGITTPILMLLSLEPTQAETAVACHITPTLTDPAAAAALSHSAQKWNRQMAAHIRVDLSGTGAGVALAAVVPLVRKLQPLSYIQLQGLYTHLYSAYLPQKNTAQQELSQFHQLVVHLQATGYPLPQIHAASSPAILNLPASRYNIVRCGNLLYGLAPEDGAADHHLVHQLFTPVMQIKSYIVDIKPIAGHTPVGYRRTSRARGTNGHLALIPTGYADLPFLMMAENATVLVRGQTAHLYGHACMDHLMIDITDMPSVRKGDEVVIIGRQGNAVNRAEDVARSMPFRNRSSTDYRTMSQAGLCMLSPRVPRLYDPHDGDTAGDDRPSSPGSQDGYCTNALKGRST